MNRILLICLILIVCPFLKSCNNNDIIIDQYELAIQKGDYDEAAELLYQIDEDDLTEEQQMRIAEITMGYPAKSLTSSYLKMIHEGSSEIDEMISETEESVTDIEEIAADMDEAYQYHDEEEMNL